MAFVIKKWKVSGDSPNVLRPSRPTKLRDRYRRVLFKEIRKNLTKPIVRILQEFQQASGTLSVFSINTIHKEAHLLGFNGNSATHKSLITISYHVARLRCPDGATSSNFGTSLRQFKTSRSSIGDDLWANFGIT
ncbi:transposable element Tc1 transposase [Trichonephila clavipes]|nr:transposable element Tc1 transposase [Trichonephila clavipes]